ncbi:MAG: aldehyde ferredoxin oxidoreductase family protein [Candidatus Schekmanbacteria bacterium]|nr:aldehyde ferredoxin oxidoreductase family protein [Candidatus Schekmanbacteria bacterium]
MKADIVNILRINLSDGKVSGSSRDSSFRKQFIGGRGINSKLLFDETGPDVKPLSEENKLIFGTGALSGTKSPASARFTVSAKSPLTGILGDANAGGNFGPELRKSGCDHLIIEGKSDHPVYIFINNGKVEIRDASKLWGKNTRETETLIRKELGDDRVRIACIGQAGENLVRFGSVMHEERAAARTGMGAVMGSKKLKAVAVRGTNEVEIADAKKFNLLKRDLHKKASETKLAKTIGKYGGTMGTPITDRIGIIALKNFNQTSGFENVQNFDPEKIVEKFYTGNKSCYACPIHCGHKFEIKEGPYKGEWGNKIEEGVVTPFGPTCYNSDIASIFKINNMVNQYGMDSLEAGGLIAVAIDLFQNGVITEKDTDGLILDWGKPEILMKLIDKIAFRQDIGDILAEGALPAAKKIGHGAEKYISHSKGMTFGGIDLRIMKGLALCLATATRGCDHLRGGVPTETVGGLGRYTPEMALKMFGTTEVLDHKSYVKAVVAIRMQHIAAITDSLEICRFASESNGGGLTIDDQTELFNVITGFNLSLDEILEAGERIFNIERLYINREGIRRTDDRLIGKWVDGPVPSGPFKGEIIDEQKWEGMLDDYYTRRNWDVKTGIPTRSKLESLGLTSEAEWLNRIGK